MRKLLLPLLVLCACSTTPKAPPDPHIWLEGVEDPKALEFVRAENERSVKHLESLPNYKRNEKEVRAILLAKDRLPTIVIMGAHVYNFWQDERHVRGLWRRTSLAEYRRKQPRWETVLDFDKLAKEEKENWVYKGALCLPPQYERCLVSLSRGGKDAREVREFDLQAKNFVKDGFRVPEAKTRIAWVNRDTVIVGTDFGPGSLTTSGYPRILKRWSRGQALGDATNLLEGQPTDMSVTAYTVFTPKGERTFLFRSLNFYEDELFELNPDGVPVRIQKPQDAAFAGWVNGNLILHLRSDWISRGETFTAGSLVALPPVSEAQPKRVFTPSPTQSVQDVEQVKDGLLLNLLDSIQSRVLRASLEGDLWRTEALPLPEKGDIKLYSTSAYDDQVIATFAGFLTPNSILYFRANANTKVETLKRLPARFDARGLQVEQLWATSRDGTKIPYFFLHSKAKAQDVPVLMYGYGGFEISQGPYYPSVVGKVWMEKGGAYVIANIRGGGEFGPKWHQAALKENRQKSFDDFIAVAEDLIARGITRPEKLAISGGSNGGLLVGAALTQKPELFRAAVCKVPLLDMLRYHQLLAGASWIAEYGDPEDKKMREVLLKYSPYQNLKAGVKYPEPFFITSTADDRVHPGHARKMVAKMKELGHPYLYFENMEGGHSAAANLEQRVRSISLEYTFLQNRLLQ